MKKIISLSLIAVAAIVLISACSKNMYVAYVPADVDVKNSGSSMQTLNQGMAVFTTNCDKCHALKQPERWTKEEWQKILVRMNKKSKLSESDAELLAAYINARAKPAEL